MKILIVTGIYPPDRGGPASYVPRIAAALAKRGHKIEVICLSDRPGNDVHRIRRGMFWPWRIAYTTFTIWRLARRHDVVYVNGLGSESAIAAWLAGKPAFHKIVGDYSWERAEAWGLFGGTLDEYQVATKSPRLRFLDWVRTFPLRMARQVIVPSRYLQKIVSGWGIENVQVVYNAVEPGPAPPRTSPAGKTLLTVCRLVPWKGVDGLIRLLPELPDTRLIIAGDGCQRSKLEALAQTYGVAERVQFLGSIPQDAVRRCFAQADAFVLNSTYEGLPHVVLEAMTAGVPVIATDAGGTGEVVENNVTGLLVPVGDSAALKAAIENIWTVGPQLAAEATRRLAGRFSFDTMVNQTETTLTGGFSVLSFGSTRGLWDGKSAEDYQRMMGYAEHLDRYVIVTNSYKRHRLKPLRLAPHVEAIPTNAFCRFDSLVRMWLIGRRAGRFSLIQAQDPFFLGLVAILLGKRFHTPVNICLYGPNIYDEHWLASHWSHRLLAPLGRWVLGRCHGIQVDGQITADRLLAAGIPPARVEVKKVVPTNLEKFLKIDRVPGKTARILYVGRFAQQKNLPLLLQSLKQLRTRDFELTLVGEGPDEPALRAMVQREGLQARVKFHGPVSRDKIAGVFANADVFALTSDYEGYPRVLMEAAAAALPIVTTAVSGADEAVVNGETGYIVPIGDSQAVAEKLDKVLQSNARMGLAGREHIRAHLDPRTNTPGQLAIWEKITSRNGAGKRLLLFNLVTDVDHPILGFTTQWIHALAAHVEHIHVITMQAGKIAVPANVTVHSVGKERGYSEPRRVVEFYRHLFRILRTERIDGCFSHMMQIFSALGGPVLRAAGIPLVTWYAHPSLTPSLKVAHLFSNRMVTSLPNAYPYRKNKLAVIGQGIDTALFAPVKAAASDDVILCVGRLSRVKNHLTLLLAFARLPRQYRLVILGATAGADDKAYAAGLRQLVAELGLRDRVVFEKPVPPVELPARYGTCAVHVNLTPAGFGDKVAWEAMSCGRPCLVANEDFRETLGRYERDLLFRDADDLADKLNHLLSKTAAERDEIGAYLREQVRQLHSLPRLADRILEQLA